MHTQSPRHSAKEVTTASGTRSTPTRPRERRRFRRLTTLMRARLFFLDQRIDAVLLDVSVSGVKLRAGVCAGRDVVCEQAFGDCAANAPNGVDVDSVTSIGRITSLTGVLACSLTDLTTRS